MTELLNFVTEFERIGDYAVNIMEKAEELNEKEASFSESAQKELILLEKAVERILTVTGEAFEGDDTQKAMQAERAVTDMTNDLLKKNAEALKMGTIETARESQRGVVDIETLQQTNKSLIETLDELNKIQNEGRAKRVAAEQELTRIEDELKTKMMEIRS